VHDSLITIVSLLVSAGAVYGGIRKDLQGIHQEISRLERALEKAHSRIDSMGGGRRNSDEH